MHYHYEVLLKKWFNDCISMDKTLMLSVYKNSCWINPNHSADTEPSKIVPPLPPKKFSNGDDHSTILSILAEKLAPTMTYIGPYWGLKTGPFL